VIAVAAILGRWDLQEHPCRRGSIFHYKFHGCSQICVCPPCFISIFVPQNNVTRIQVWGCKSDFYV
jgi:hypothetical protein